MSEEDSEDWVLVRDGHTAALTRLIERHSDRLFRHACRYLSAREDAQDAVVIAFFEMWRKRGAVRLVEGSPLPWLLNTVSNTARNLERSARRYQRLLARNDAATRPNVTPAPSLPDESGVLAALERLPARERDVLVLSIVEDIPEKQVAQVLGIPLGTVKSRISRGKARLRTAMTPPEA